MQQAFPAAFPITTRSPLKVFVGRLNYLLDKAE